MAVCTCTVVEIPSCKPVTDQVFINRWSVFKLPVSWLFDFSVRSFITLIIETLQITLFYAKPLPPLTHRTHYEKLTPCTASSSIADNSTAQSFVRHQTITLTRRQSFYSCQWQTDLKCVSVCFERARVRKAPVVQPLMKYVYSLGKENTAGGFSSLRSSPH